MSKLGVTLDILNQKGTPAFYSDIFTNRPAAGFAGRVFISTDTGAIYEDTGSTWTLIADATGVVTTPSLQSVTTVGNTTTQGISITAGGLSSNQVSIVGGTASQFLKADGTLDSSTYLTTGSAASTYLPLAGGTLTGNLSIPSSQLAIGTATAGAPLDIHTTTGTAAQFNGTGTNNAYIFFQNAGTSKWRIGNYYNGATNQFTIYNNAAAVTQLVMDSGETTLIGNFTATTLIKSGGTSAQFLKADGSVDSNTYITTNTSQTIAAGITKTWNNEMRFGLGTMYDNSTGVSLATGFTTINAGLTGSNTFLQVWRSNAYKLTFNCDLTSAGSTFTLPAGQSNALIATATGTSSQLIAGDGSLISAGTNITISAGTISASGGGSGVTSLSAIGSTANANGATITGSVLNLQPASASFGGVVTTGTQSFAGAKTFSSTIQATGFTATGPGYSTFYGLRVSGNDTGNTIYNGAANIGITSDSGTRIFIGLPGSTTTGLNVITATGNVLIGTATDAGYKLDVQGTLRSTGAATFGGLITSTLGNNTLLFSSTSATTGYQYAKIQNTSGYLLFGIESSTGAIIQTGSSAYASVVTTGTATDLSLGTNQVQRFVLNGTTGAATLSSTLGINGTSDNIKSGTYTPTVTAGTNCAAVTAYTCQYMRVSNVVTVSGKVYGSATATNTETQFTMTVPVNSNFASVEQCGGTGRSAEGGVAPSGAGYVAYVQAVSANTVRFSYTAPAVLGTGGNFWFSFTYLIV